MASTYQYRANPQRLKTTQLTCPEPLIAEPFAEPTKPTASLVLDFQDLVEEEEGEQGCRLHPRCSTAIHSSLPLHGVHVLIDVFVKRVDIVQPQLPRTTASNILGA